MAIKYKITRFDKKKIDGIAEGLIVGITCERFDDLDNLIATAYIDGEIPKEDFSSWPPSKAEIRQAIKNWLLYEDPDAQVPADSTRLKALKKRVNKKVIRYEKDPAMLNEEVIPEP